MKLLLVTNPMSGRGKAALLADQFAAALGPAGHEVARAQIDVGGSPANGRAEEWRTNLGNHEVIVVFGGDGTVHNLLPAVSGTGAALYQVPMGTENLFARQFGMDRSPATLVRALRGARLERIDVGVANGRLFALMCSAGPDASVVRRLAANRRGAIRHRSYIAPVLREILAPALGPMSVEADGQTVVQQAHGLLVIGNSPMYALGLNPARDALMSDGALDVVFLPAASALGMLGWAWHVARGTHLRRAGAVFRRARDVVVRTQHATPYQLDGDVGGLAGAAEGELRIGVRAGAVSVLTTAPA